MTRSTRLTSLCLVLTLLLTTVPGALAGQHGDAASNADAASERPEPADTWARVKSLLSEGNASSAREAFDAAFGTAGATHHAVALDYAATAFDELDALDDPSSAEWAAWSQVAKKSTFAIGYAALRDAIEEGDVDAAKTWFGILEAKFSKDSELPASKAAFANLTLDSAAEARATLDAEYADFMQYKVSKEAMETPLLLGPDPVKAAAEAGEALGYFLAIQPAFNATLGADANGAALHALDDLVKYTLTGNEAKVDHYALEVRNAMARYAVTTSSDEKVGAWADAKSAMKDGNVTRARAIYDAEFAHAAEETVPAEHERILAAFDAADAALAEGDNTTFLVQVQIVDKGILHVAFEAFVHEALEGETDEALAYFSVLGKKFGWGGLPDGYLAAARLAAANSANDADIAAAKALAYETHFGKVREEVEEVFMNWDDPAEALEKAIEGVMYFAPLKADVAERLGAAVADELESEVLELYDATLAGDRAAAEDAAGEIETLLVQYEAGGAEVTELDAIVSGIKGKVNFVVVEYRDYFAFLEEGEEEEAAIELEEAKTFTAGARDQFDKHVDLFTEAAGDAYVADVHARFDSIATLLDDLAPFEDVEAEATALIGLIESIPGPSDSDDADEETSEDTDESGTVSITFGTPTLKGADPRVFTVPVLASGLPQSGAALQFSVDFDPEVLEATEVEVTFGEIGDGVVRAERVIFNAASTKPAQSEEELAVITFTLKDPSAAAATLDLEVEELADGNGKALGVNDVLGGELDLTALAAADPANAGQDDDFETGGEDTKQTPFPAALGVLTALGAALVLRGRKEE